MTTTTPLPPYPTTPRYSCIDEIIKKVWEESMVLEEKFYETGDEMYVEMFALNIVIIQFWEELNAMIEEDSSI
jgi:hypothetical protein